MSGVGGGAVVDDEKKRYECPARHRTLDFEKVCWRVSAARRGGEERWLPSQISFGSRLSFQNEVRRERSSRRIILK